ncbi:hypothetical protein V492_02250 [Pseudogymnoascus sp. VKM F-4246]|nr:hypothetical protein V492_02250 [Pseudogymnoascus sp. VKM F-4246]
MRRIPLAYVGDWRIERDSSAYVAARPCLQCDYAIRRTPPRHTGYSGQKAEDKDTAAPLPRKDQDKTHPPPLHTLPTNSKPISSAPQPQPSPPPRRQTTRLDYPQPIPQSKASPPTGFLQLGAGVRPSQRGRTYAHRIAHDDGIAQSSSVCSVRSVRSVRSRRPTDLPRSLHQSPSLNTTHHGLLHHRRLHTQPLSPSLSLLRNGRLGVQPDAIKLPVPNAPVQEAADAGRPDPARLRGLRLLQPNHFNTEFEVLGGFLSPVSDAYKKAGLTSSRHRLRMCELAVQQTSNWLMVDPWEALQEKYTPTALVLDHFEHEINVVQGGVLDVDGNPRPVRIALLAGADLIQTMSTPLVWSAKDLEHILGRYGTFIVERTGTDIDDALSSLQAWKEKIWVIPQLILNDVSSTKIRLFLRREMSVRYLIPAQVIEYIEENGLYEEEGAEGKGKGKDKERGKEKTTGSETAGETLAKS